MPVSNLSSTEEIARATLARLLGTRVEQHDDQSRDSMFDLIVRWPEGDEAAEVVADMDQRRRARMVAGSRLPPVLQDPALTAGWVVSLTNSARINEVKQHLLPVLRALEKAGCTEVDSRGESTPWAGLAQSAHISNARVEQGAQAGRVVVLAGLSEVGTPMPPDGLSSYVTSVLAEHDDIRTKLSMSGLDKTHAVVLVSTDRVDVLFALDDEEDGMPTTDPDVPVEISDVWLLPLWPGGRVLRWNRQDGWTHAGFMSDPLSTE